jgi:hypothetical protein
MADIITIKISELSPLPSVIADTDVLVVVRGSTTYKVTKANLFSLSLSQLIDINLPLSVLDDSVLTWDAATEKWVSGFVAWDDVSGKPVTFPPESHTHPYQPTSEKNAANGYAGLGGDGKLAASQLPPLAISSIFVVGSEIDQLSLTSQEGDVAIRSDESKTYFRNSGTSGTMADWSQVLSPTAGDVTSVEGRTGVVTLGDLYAAISHKSRHATGGADAISPADIGAEVAGAAAAAQAFSTQRSNHTGTQLAATISNFAATVLATVLSGLSVATATPVTSSDTILAGIGKLQAQLTGLADIFAPIAKGVTNGDSHDHSGGDGAQIDHASVSGAGTNSHATIDTHLGAANPHTGSAPLDSPALTGLPTAPTATVGTNTNQVATTSFSVAEAAAAQANAVQRSNHTGTQLAATILNFADSVRGTVLTGLSLVTTSAIEATDSILVAFGKLQAQITTLSNTYAPLNSPTLTGNPTAPTPTAGDNDTSVATTAFVNTQIAADVSRIPIDGWIAGSGTWTYSSADAPTFVFNIPSDVTGIIQPGYRIKLTQSTVKYFIVTAVGAFSGGNTPVTVYGGTDFTLTIGTITNPFFSPVKAPRGFPVVPSKWTVVYSNTANQSVSTPGTSPVNPGSMYLDVPIGEWVISANMLVWVEMTSGDSPTRHSVIGGLGLDSTSILKDLMFYFLASSSNIIANGGRLVGSLYTATSKTRLYINCACTTLTPATNTIRIRGDTTTTKVEATCGYL